MEIVPKGYFINLYICVQSNKITALVARLTTHNVTHEGWTFCRHCIVEFISTLYTPLPNRHAAAAHRLGGDKDTGGDSDGGGTDNQQSTKSSGGNGDINGNDDSDDDK